MKKTNSNDSPDESNTNLSGDLLNVAFDKIKSLEEQILKEKLSRIELTENVQKLAETVGHIIQFMGKLKIPQENHERKNLEDIQSILKNVENFHTPN